MKGDAELSGLLRFGILASLMFLIARPIAAQTNVVIRVMASNLSSGTNQRYETPGLDILKGLKPDIVAMQEFNYASTSNGINTAAAIREMVDNTFGTNFVYFRESGYAIPNGIISRYPIVTNGSWVDSDTGVNDRGYAWAQIDVPGTNDLFIVSVHLKASSGSDNEARRGAEASEVTALIQSNFPANAWIIVAGDMNLYSDTEAAITTFKTYLSDSPVPADQNGNQNTNEGRSSRYDRVLPSFSMTNCLTPVVLPHSASTNGLVFDSRVYTPLSDVPPVVSGDSGASGMQHMGVVKDFSIASDATPGVLVVSPISSVNLAGEQGGPFVPDSQTYVLTNAGGSTLTWSASVSNNWLSVSLPVSYMLGPGHWTTVTVSTNSSTAALVGGWYTNLVSFVNVTNGAGNTNVVWTILVRDGISDAWRQQYFGHIEPEASDGSRAQDDPDGDGLNNLQEQAAGTDPTSSVSALRITSITREGADLRVTWATGLGKTNALQFATGGLGDSYSNNFSDLFIVTNTTDTATNWLDVGGAVSGATRYYRVRLVP